MNQDYVLSRSRHSDTQIKRMYELIVNVDKYNMKDMVELDNQIFPLSDMNSHFRGVKISNTVLNYIGGSSRSNLLKNMQRIYPWCQITDHVYLNEFGWDVIMKIESLKNDIRHVKMKLCDVILDNEKDQVVNLLYYMLPLN